MYNTFQLRKKRTVSESVSDVFNYLKIHIWNLLKLMMVLVGPFFILGGILIGRVYGTMFSMFETTLEPNPFDFALFIPAYILLIIGGIFYQASIVSYMKMSLKHAKDEITLQLIFTDIKKYFWKYLGAGILLGIGISFVGFIVTLVLSIISPVLGVFVMMFGLIYLMIAFSIYPFSIGIEDASITDSFGRSFELIKGNWWSTFGYYILLYFIQGFISAIVIVPFYILAFYKMFSQLITNPNSQPDFSYLGSVMTFGIPIIMFVSLFLYCFYSVGFGMRYFSLVELKEEVGLAEQIEAMNVIDDSTEKPLF
ncbi:DUF7847 domain-containing protein [Saccharicrinis aurantiacus]|uniref:DUF7847 domain-containing protein n=1 Tax=Saccharicrinis aurantiacus TaxID=1849719 RepID=UPI00094FE713|nr:hypothetical protein [Saccharicrinis aurantiacus]